MIELFADTSLSDVLAKGIAREGMNMRFQKVPWPVAGPVYLVGDYYESDLYEESKSYRNISRQLVEEWNRFIELPENQIRYAPCDGEA